MPTTDDDLFINGMRGHDVSALAQLLHSLCHNCYVRIPRMAVAVLQPHVPSDDALLKQLRAQIQPDKADAAAVQIACCLNQPLPDISDAPLDFESYFATSPDALLQSTPYQAEMSDVMDAAALSLKVSALPADSSDDDSLLRELDELLDL